MMTFEELMKKLEEPDNTKYLFSKHRRNTMVKKFLKDMTKKQLEEDLFKHFVLYEDIKDLVGDKKRLWKKDTEKLKELLTFEKGK